ncbi:MAG: putative CAMK family protein kinase [Streblomastix strix]|uniref:Putative CAMK family protein kinase n=1 Tax=Streblomastix strix TaxID=222440 RepID=A0A5J4UQN1_9EUKA|nr:MAG: putative CAMK family protein kinase [Streblomastix strix]
MYGINTVILMDYANLKSLDCLLSTLSDLPIPTIRAIMRQLLEGLRLMHEKGLIHRDIKGQNVLFHSPPGSGRIVLKIADFGLVKVQKQDTTSQMTVAGTVPYMAPELLLGDQQGNVIGDQKVDVWSSGILLYQLVTHEFPFKTQTLQAINTFMFNKTLERPKYIYDNLLWDLITKMLAFDRKNRFTVVEALKHQFFTGQQVFGEITQQIQSLALIAKTSKQNGDMSISQYDMSTLFIVPLLEIRQILDVHPEQENIQLQSQIININVKKNMGQNQFQKIQAPGSQKSFKGQQLMQMPRDQQPSFKQQSGHLNVAIFEGCFTSFTFPRDEHLQPQNFASPPSSNYNSQKRMDQYNQSQQQSNMNNNNNNNVNRERGMQQQ